ncbi:MAG: sugar phosphate isomerase/epimerase family protein [Lysobacterales bacterium]
MHEIYRRHFNIGLLAAAAASALPLQAKTSAEQDEIFKLAVMTWSFQFKIWKGELQASEVPALIAGFGADALEWDAKTFRDLRGGREQMFQAAPAAHFQDLRKAADDAGVRNRVLSAGGPFFLASVDAAGRQVALDYFMQWLEPAQILGCDILRAELYCNAPPGPDREREAKKLAMEGLHGLLDKTADTNLIINVENHHGISSQPDWLADLVRSMAHPRIGLCADTNTFRIDQDNPYDRDFSALPRYVDRYHGLEVLMPLANWVSAKTYAFDGTGYEVSMNYPRIFEIFRDSGYTGYLSIEYEGEGDPIEGVRKSAEMLQRLRKHFVAA